ncbi:MAG: hypothetical protein CMJ89_16800 [Planctomycetes bacterium]|nr:hypothetical protein [Planctomycetota bacterium]
MSFPPFYASGIGISSTHLRDGRASPNTPSLALTGVGSMVYAVFSALFVLWIVGSFESREFADFVLR